MLPTVIWKSIDDHGSNDKSLKTIAADEYVTDHAKRGNAVTWAHAHVRVREKIKWHARVSRVSRAYCLEQYWHACVSKIYCFTDTHACQHFFSVARTFIVRGTSVIKLMSRVFPLVAWSVTYLASASLFFLVEPPIFLSVMWIVWSKSERRSDQVEALLLMSNHQFSYTS